MSTERQIFNYIVSNAGIRDENQLEALVEQMNDAIIDVISSGVYKGSRYFELYRSSKGNFYWYVMINTSDFKRWIVTDVSKMNLKEIEFEIQARRAIKARSKKQKKPTQSCC